ncbi:MAG: hypothetical protein WBF75_23050, partial [Pseudonocardiaceae bacterium]
RRWLTATVGTTWRVFPTTPHSPPPTRTVPGAPGLPQVMRQGDAVLLAAVPGGLIFDSGGARAGEGLRC